MEFRDMIKQRRTQLGLTLDDVGRAVGVSKATVQRWESGLIQNLRRDKIAKLAEVLDISPDRLVLGDESDDSSCRLFAAESGIAGEVMEQNAAVIDAAVRAAAAIEAATFSVDARRVARAYEAAGPKIQGIVRAVLDLPD